MTTPMDEIDRIVERLRRERGSQINDSRTFDLNFNFLFELREDELTLKQKQLREKVFREYKDKFNTKVTDFTESREKPKASTRRITKDERVFIQAGGKNIQQDRKQDSKIIVTDSKKFTNAQKQDLQNIDTKKFIFRQTITRNKRQVTIFRDRRGRFTKQ